MLSSELYQHSKTGKTVLFMVTTEGILVFNPVELLTLYEAVKALSTGDDFDNAKYKTTAQQRFMKYKLDVGETLVTYSFTNTPYYYVYKNTPFINAVQIYTLTANYLAFRQCDAVYELGMQIREWVHNNHSLKLLMHHASLESASSVVARAASADFARHAVTPQHRNNQPLRSPPPVQRKRFIHVVESDEEEEGEKQQQQDADDENEEEEERQFVPPPAPASPQAAVDFGIADDLQLRVEAKEVIDDLPSSSSMKQKINKSLLMSLILKVLKDIKLYLTNLLGPAFGVNVEFPDDEAKQLWQKNVSVVQDKMNELLAPKKYYVAIKPNTPHQVFVHASN